MDSTDWNVHFCFYVLLHPRLFCFVINPADTWKYATNESRAFCAMDNHVERPVLRPVKTKTVRIKSLLCKKVFKSYPSYIVIAHLKNSLKFNYSLSFDIFTVVSFDFFFQV